MHMRYVGILEDHLSRTYPCHLLILLYRPWGNQECHICTGVCSGHYCNQLVDVTDPVAIERAVKPPSLVLKHMFSELGNQPVTDEFITNAARSVLLPIEETKVWIDHLTTILQNRKRGAAKAAATRRLKRHAMQTQGLIGVLGSSISDTQAQDIRYTSTKYIRCTSTRWKQHIRYTSTKYIRYTSTRWKQHVRSTNTGNTTW